MNKRFLLIYPHSSMAAEFAATLREDQSVDRWRDDIQGAVSHDGLPERIEAANAVVADVTRPTFNTGFCLGFAAAVGKPMLLLSDSAGAKLPRWMSLGIFESLGCRSYASIEEVEELVSDIPARASSIPLPKESVSQRSPVYYVAPRRKSASEVRILSRIKKARLQFRSYDPEEVGRLSAREAASQVHQSHAVIARLLEPAHEESESHNSRVGFLVGLAMAWERLVLLLQPGDEPIPLRYQDFVSSYHDLPQIDRHIADFAPGVTARLQSLPARERKPQALLERLNLGASAAENELAELEHYYLPTHHFQQAQRGEIEVVAGRKGTGKTAFFIQLRDRLRRDRHFVVLDLMPEGFQLLKFKEQVVSLLSEGTQEHTITAFWEYLLLLEVAQKLLRTDEKRRFADHRLFEPYKKLSAAFAQSELLSDGDFSERMLELTEKVSHRLTAATKRLGQSSLNASQITEVLYSQDLPTLRDLVFDYLLIKKELWILFDNLDKGWPAQGLEDSDVLIIRCLLSALSKLKRTLQKKKFPCHTLLFIRNDVYDLLVATTPDKGKTARASLDWSDAQILRELLRRRFAFGLEETDEAATFEELWHQIAISHVEGEESSQYLIDRSLMRPRYLVELVRACHSHAINTGSTRIELEDIKAGVENFSAELVSNISYEPEGSPHFSGALGACASA